VRIQISFRNFIPTIIGILPFLSQYRIPWINLNLGLLMVLLISSWGLINMIYTRSFINWLPGIVYLVIGYLLVNVIVTSEGLVKLIIFLYGIIPIMWLCNNGLIDIQKIERTIIVVSVLASIVVFVQYFTYYGFGLTLTTGRVMLPLSSFLESSEYLETSMLSGALFRPAGFFLEPAHFIQYALVAVIIIQFQNFRSNKLVLDSKAVVISVGCILTTSGMGLVLTPAIWVYYIIAKKGFSKKKLFAILAGIMVVVLVISFLSKTSFFNLTIERLLGSGNSTESAFIGRMYTSYFLEELSGLSKVIGTGFQNVPIYSGTYRTGAEYYMTGIVELQYSVGIIGTVLTILLILYFVINRKNEQRIIAGFFLILIFIAARIKLVDFVFYGSLVYRVTQYKQQKLWSRKDESW